MTSVYYSSRAMNLKKKHIPSSSKKNKTKVIEYEAEHENILTFVLTFGLSRYHFSFDDHIRSCMYARAAKNLITEKADWWKHRYGTIDAVKTHVASIVSPSSLLFAAATEYQSVKDFVFAVSTELKTVFDLLFTLQARGLRLRDYCGFATDLDIPALLSEDDLSLSKETVNSFRDFGIVYQTALSATTVTEAQAVLKRGMEDLYKHIAILEESGVKLVSFVKMYHQ